MARRWFGFRLSLVSIGLAMMAASSGCDSGGFVPAPPAELQGELGGDPGTATGRVVSPADSSTTSARSNTIDLILASHDANEAEFLKMGARLQAGYEKFRIRIEEPGEGSGTPEAATKPAGSQADLVRQAIRRHPQVIVVEPASSVDRPLAQAIDEARGAGIPVVLVGRSMADPGPTPTGSGTMRPVIAVTPPSFSDSARQLVAAAIRNAKNAKLEPKGGALLLINTGADPFVADRVAAVRDALKAAGITAVDEIRFEGDAEAAEKVLTQGLRANPKPSMVFSFDLQGSGAALQTNNKIVAERPFVIAGYTSDEGQLKRTQMGDFAAMAEYSTVRMLRKAISMAAAVANGQSVRSPVEIRVDVSESPPLSALPMGAIFEKAQMKREAATREEIRQKKGR